jgi:hypothetical protein
MADQPLLTLVDGRPTSLDPPLPKLRFATLPAPMGHKATGLAATSPCSRPPRGDHGGPVSVEPRPCRSAWSEVAPEPGTWGDIDVLPSSISVARRSISERARAGRLAAGGENAANAPLGQPRRAYSIRAFSRAKRGIIPSVAKVNTHPRAKGTQRSSETLFRGKSPRLTEPSETEPGASPIRRFLLAC